MKVCIIGAGISGISLGRLLKDKYNVTIYEQDRKIGGLIKCDIVNGNLYHKVGGHVFNSKNQKVLDWFWSHFNKESEFVTAKRNAKILIGTQLIDYPIENHLYQLDEELIKKIIKELLVVQVGKKADNFKEFLVTNFGNTLYNLYFEPYNSKIWKTDLNDIPLEWLEGKLPMPEVIEILRYNILRDNESQMVHSTFYYPRNNGSQFIIDRLSQGLDIKVNEPIEQLDYKNDRWIINDEFDFDKVVYTGHVTNLNRIIKNMNGDLENLLLKANNLKYTSTSNVFCECDRGDISWLYIPDADILPHRIIYTGNFAEQNNKGTDRSTCVVEFSGQYADSVMINELPKLPGNLKPIATNQSEYSYVIQTKETKDLIDNLKMNLKMNNFYLLGRFAEWEYYNMDKCIEASMALAEMI